MPAHVTRHRYDGAGRYEYFDKQTGQRFPVGASLSERYEFTSSSLVIPAAWSAESGMPWVKKIVGAAPPTVAGVADATNGVIACTLTADDQKQNAEIYFNDELNLSARQGLVFQARVALSVVPTVLAEVVVGVCSAWADGIDATAQNAIFTMDGSGEIFAEKDDAATDESATTGVTVVADEYVWLCVDFTDYADVKFFVNGVRKATGTTFDWAASVGNSKLQPIIGCYKLSGVGVATLLVDHVSFWQSAT